MPWLGTKNMLVLVLTSDEDEMETLQARSMQAVIVEVQLALQVSGEWDSGKGAMQEDYTFVRNNGRQHWIKQQVLDKEAYPDESNDQTE